MSNTIYLAGKKTPAFDAAKYFAEKIQKDIDQSIQKGIDKSLDKMLERMYENPNEWKTMIFGKGAFKNG